MSAADAAERASLHLVAGGVPLERARAAMELPPAWRSKAARVLFEGAPADRHARVARRLLEALGPTRPKHTGGDPTPALTWIALVGLVISGVVRTYILPVLPEAADRELPVGLFAIASILAVLGLYVRNRGDLDATLAALVLPEPIRAAERRRHSSSWSPRSIEQQVAWLSACAAGGVPPRAIFEQLGCGSGYFEVQLAAHARAKGSALEVFSRWAHRTQPWLAELAHPIGGESVDDTLRRIARVTRRFGEREPGLTRLGRGISQLAFLVLVGAVGALAWNVFAGMLELTEVIS